MAFTIMTAADWERIDELKCLNKANASAKVQEIDALIDDLSKNWRPTGYYSIAEVDAITKQVTAADGQARISLSSAPHSTSDAAQVIAQAHAYLDRNDERAKVYIDAAHRAQAAGINAIDAPGLRDWVLNSLVNISQAYVTIAALACREGWLDTAAKIARGITNTAKAIGNGIVAAGATVIRAVEGAINFWPYLKWGLLAVGVLGGGLWAYGRVRRFYHENTNFPPLLT